MGNSIIVQRIKGITNYYASTNISEFSKGDFLKIVPEFDNPFDSNALAIYDLRGHKLGFVDRNSNILVYEKIRNNDYVCVITDVYNDYITPSIEYMIIYSTKSSREEISSLRFSQMLNEYNRVCNYGNRNNVVKKGEDNSYLYDKCQKFIKIICDFFGTDVETDLVECYDQDESYETFIFYCFTNNATKNKDVIKVKNSYFMHRTFTQGAVSCFQPNGGIPDGYSKEEIIIFAPIPGYNDSFDSDYVDYIYDIVAPMLDPKPFMFENFFGQICVCLQLDITNFDTNNLNKDNITKLMNILKESVDKVYSQCRRRY